MTLRLMQAAAILVLAACGAATSESSAQQSAKRPFAVSDVTTFDSPWALDFLPGSGVRMTNLALVTEKDGKLWLVDVTNGQKQEVAGVPKVHVEGQGGLAEVVAHPDFAGNQRIYLSFPEAGPDGTSGAVGRLREADLRAGQPRLEGFKIIWRQEPKVKGGGSLFRAHRLRP